MSTATLCGVCEAAPAIESCPQCGTPVCRDHYRRELGSCDACAGGGRRF